MRVGFEVSALRAPHSGVATYTMNLLQQLQQLQRVGGDEIVPLAPSALRLPGGRGRRLRVVNTVWLQAVLPWHLARLGADVCHFTNSVGAWWAPCPSIVTIHDTTLWSFPGCHPRRRLMAMRPFIPLGARRASAIIAVSASTRRDVVRTLGVPADKVHVVYEAPAGVFRPLGGDGDRDGAAALEAVRVRYDLPRSFVLYVGTIEPRKNLIRLLEAFLVVRRCGFAGHGLVLVGNRGWRDAAVLRCIERLGLGGVVRLLGYVPTESLVALYNLAAAVAFPSLYEGFGLPVVEAMACGAPVVASPNGSLGEVAGGAAELVEPTSVESIAAGLRRVLGDGQRRAELRAAGLARAAEFSWQRAAAETRGVYGLVARPG